MVYCFDFLLVKYIYDMRLDQCFFLSNEIHRRIFITIQKLSLYPSGQTCQSTRQWELFFKKPNALTITYRNVLGIMYGQRARDS